MAYSPPKTINLDKNLKDLPSLSTLAKDLPPSVIQTFSKLRPKLNQSNLNLKNSQKIALFMVKSHLDLGRKNQEKFKNQIKNICQDLGLRPPSATEMKVIADALNPSASKKLFAQFKQDRWLKEVIKQAVTQELNKDPRLSQQLKDLAKISDPQTKEKILNEIAAQGLTGLVAAAVLPPERREKINQALAALPNKQVALPLESQKLWQQVEEVAAAYEKEMPQAVKLTSETFRASGTDSPLGFPPSPSRSSFPEGSLFDNLDQGAGKIFDPALKFLGETKPGKAVTSWLGNLKSDALTKLFGKEATKAAAALATKAGFKGALATALAAVPVIGPLLSALMALDLAKAIPVIGPLLKKALGLLNPLGWLKKGLAGLFNGDFSPEAMGAAAVPLLIAAPLTALFPGFSGPIWQTAGITSGAGVGIGLFNKYGSNLLQATSHASGNFANSASSFLTVLPALTAPVFPAGLIIGIIIASLLLVFFIVVMIAGGAFSIQPYQATNTSPDTDTSPKSKYFLVEKTANPSNFSKNELEKIWDSGKKVTVQYTITITSEKESLHITNLVDTFSVTPDSPEIPVSLLEKKLPLEIQPENPLSFSYNLEFDRSYKDSLVTNQVIVTADIENGPSQESAGDSASVFFGEVSLLCFNLDASWNNVPNYKNKLLAELNYLITNHPNYIAKICAGGITTIRYGGIYCKKNKDGSETCYRGMCGKSPGGTCTFYKTLLEQSSAYIFYTLTHELGHRLNWVNVPLFDSFVTEVHCQPGDTVCEEYLPSYAYYHGGYCPDYEDWAETCAWYTQMVRYNNCYNETYACYNRLDEDYPLHYNFAKNKIF